MLERLEAGGEGDNRGLDGWMASLTQWTLVWVNSGSWWRTGRPDVLRFMGSHRVRHDWVTELNWTEWDQMPWSSFSECWALSLLFHSPLSLSSRSSLVLLPFSAIRVGSSAYLRLLIFLPAILIPVCASSSPTFGMMFSAYKLNKQGDYIQRCRPPFPVLNQSVVPCLVLTTSQLFVLLLDLHTDFSRAR